MAACSCGRGRRGRTVPIGLTNGSRRRRPHLIGWFNGEWQDFVDDGGYDAVAVVVGWQHRQRAGLTARKFWRSGGGRRVTHILPMSRCMSATEPSGMPPGGAALHRGLRVTGLAAATRGKPRTPTDNLCQPKRCAPPVGARRGTACGPSRCQGGRSDPPLRPCPSRSKITRYRGAVRACGPVSNWDHPVRRQIFAGVRVGGTSDVVTWGGSGHRSCLLVLTCRRV